MAKSQMPVKVSDWNYPKIKVYFGEEDSSVVRSMEMQKQHDNGLFDLVVRFSGDSIYHYFDVEETDISQILFSHSIGSTFNRLISKSDKYRFEKVF